MTGMGYLPSFTLRTSTPAIGLILLLAGTATAAERFTITPQQRWSGVLGGTQVKLNYTVTVPEDLPARLGWSLSVQERTITRGETTLTARGNRLGHAVIQLQVPEVKPGVVLEGRLSVVLYDGRRQTKLAGHERILRIFSSAPFAGRSQWLEELNLALFDPQGDTAAVFQRAEIPFEQIHNVAALAERTRGVLVIGQGTSFADYRSLPETVMRLAAGGVPVICLAPSAGTLPMPGVPAAGLPRAEHVVLRRQDAITTLDKRLDAEAWPPDGKVVASSISPTAAGQRVVGRVAADEKGWSWIEVHYPRSARRLPGRPKTLVICGFDMVDHWDAGPAPRYLFARILEFVTGRE